MRRVLVVGATSAIAQAAGRRFAADGDALCLVGRDGDRLGAVAADLRVRGAAHVAVLAADLADPAAAAGLVAAARSALNGLTHVLVAHGVLVEQAMAQADPGLADLVHRVNFASAAAVLAAAAAELEPRKTGVIAVIGSVAGDRGRRKNYVYGAAKAALHAYASGLRSRLHPAGVRVVTIKPGFVETPMTDRLPKTALFASAEAVGEGVYRAMLHPRDVVYLPWWWRPILAVVRAIPEPVFKRLNV